MARLFRRRKKEDREMPVGSAISFKKEGGLQQSISKHRQPLDYLRQKGVVKDEENEEYIKEVRKLCRAYYTYTDLIPMIITIYANFPLQGMRIACKTAKQQELFDKQFMDPEGLNYRQYLPEVGKEFFKVGEVNSFAFFDHETKWWISEEILNPDTVVVEDSVFAREEEVSLDVSESLKDALSMPGSAEEEYLAEAYPDLADAVATNRRVVLNPDFIFRMVEKADPWDNRGTPIMMRAFDSLLQMETLNAAQDAVADRLYSPLVLARLGIPAGEMGKDQPPWIPTQEQLNAFTAQIDTVLAADFRFIAHHFGLDIRSVFGRESMPNLTNDFDRLERKIMRAFGIGQGLLDGSNSGAYASSAINRDFVSQLMATYQAQIQALFKKRARIFAEARGIFETTIGDSGEEEVLMETIADVQEDGSVVLMERPVIYVPELVFSSNPLRDPSFELNLLMTMRQAGVAISDQTIVEASTLNVDLVDELDKITEEAVDKKIAEISRNARLEEELEKIGIDPSKESMEAQGDALESLMPDENNQSSEKVEQETNTYKPSREIQ